MKVTISLHCDGWWIGNWQDTFKGKLFNSVPCWSYDCINPIITRKILDPWFMVYHISSCWGEECHRITFSC